MKIITWNVRHQAKTGNRNLHKMAEALGTLSPDIIVLTEYFPGDVHNKFISDLESMGFKSITSECPATPETQNHVLIASRMPMKRGDSRVPTHIYEPIPCNILHVTIPETHLGILGLRMPMKMTAAKKKGWWDWITAVAEASQNHPFIILGDFNTDESSKGPNGWRRIKKLIDDNWYDARPKEGVSYWSYGKDKVVTPFKIDHALFSRCVTVRNSEYITESGEFTFVKIPGEQNPKALSDHAVLLVEFDLN
jgi:endonuclease/exonuclease/phosphatase family metal-dependent hydrolase